MSPDPTGTLIWINIGPAMSQSKKPELFYGRFNPAATFTKTEKDCRCEAV